MVNPLINMVAFYLGWFACILGATGGVPWLGPIVMAILLVLHLFLAEERQQEIRLIILTGVFGTILDSLLMVSGMYSFTNHSLSWICPMWMTALWMGFASTLNHSMRWMQGRYSLALIFGAVGGPLSYYAGVRLGALTFLPPFFVSMAILAIIWGLAVPALMWLARTITRRQNPAKSLA